MDAPLRHRLYRCVARARRTLAGPPARGSRALLYHAVGDALPDDPYGIDIREDLFARHIDALAAPGAGLTVGPFEAPGPEGLLSITFDDGFRSVLTAAAPVLVERGLPFTVFVTTGFVRGASPLYLRPPELKSLRALPGVSVGSHGATHRRLDALSDADLREELTASKRYLEDLLGQAVTALSYPHGGVDRRVRDAAERAGYRLGGTSRYGMNPPGRDPLLLCRTEVTAWDDDADFRLKVDGYWDWYRLRHRDPASDGTP